MERHKQYDNLPRPVVVMETRWPTGVSSGWHSHARGQLLYATEGIMVVHTDAGSWVVPPNRALWMLPGLRHTVTMSGDVLMRTAYIDTGKISTLPTQSGVINVSPCCASCSWRPSTLRPTARCRAGMRGFSNC
ncbi:AraC family ligand binding domain-containing protein [Comamonas endophytica]|uniref:AraC family ligand binding domain-containing protein n=1 Tax=Comamonas endophytica TaxID=2949090 RepID=UPI0036145DA1